MQLIFFCIDFILSPPQQHEEAIKLPQDAYAIAKRRGLHQCLSFQSTLSILDIAKRIYIQYDTLVLRYNEKRLKEGAYYAAATEREKKKEDN